MGTVAIVDYGLCNLDSVRRAVEECGGEPLLTNRPDAVMDADRVILPGVGAFPEAMANLRRDGLDAAMTRRVVEQGHPFLGICLGMQLMAERGLEGRPTSGLGWISGEVRRLEPGNGSRVPHIGWNEVVPAAADALFAGIPSGADFYFVHSYVVHPADAGDILGLTPYGDRNVVSAVRRGNMWGVQFHPEKSQKIGFTVLRNFLAA
jgi:imidazole glycerol-phosphate synthase subunit HisH